MEINAIKVTEKEDRKLKFPSESVDNNGDTVTIPLESLKTSTHDGMYLKNVKYENYKICSCIIRIFISLFLQ